MKAQSCRSIQCKLSIYLERQNLDIELFLIKGVFKVGDIADGLLGGLALLLERFSTLGSGGLARFLIVLAWVVVQGAYGLGTKVLCNNDHLQRKAKSRPGARSPCIREGSGPRHRHGESPPLLFASALAVRLLHLRRISLAASKPIPAHDLLRINPSNLPARSHPK